HNYELIVGGVGTYSVSIDNGAVSVASAVTASPNGRPDFVMSTDAETLARLPTGTSPLRLLLGRRLRISGKRRRALKLRRMAGDLTMRDIARAGVEPDPNLVYRALPYGIDPGWTAGHRFIIKYEMLADEAGAGGSGARRDGTTASSSARSASGGSRRNGRPGAPRTEPARKGRATPPCRTRTAGQAAAAATVARRAPDSSHMRSCTRSGNARTG